MYRQHHRKFLIDGSLLSVVQDVIVFSETQICFASSCCVIRCFLSLFFRYVPNVILFSLEWDWPSYFFIQRYILTREPGDVHNVLSLCVVSPAVPLWVGLSGEEFDFVLLWVHPCDSVDELCGFGGVTFSSLAVVLFFIACTSWLWYSALCTDDTYFTGRHSVVSRISDCLVPDEGNCFVLEAPCFEDIDRYIELWLSLIHI